MAWYTTYTMAENKIHSLAILLKQKYAYFLYVLIFLLSVSPAMSTAQTDDVTDLNQQLESNKKKRTKGI